MCFKNKKTFEIYVVVIINCTNVIWEIFDSTANIYDVKRKMKNKYKYIISISSINEEEGYYYNNEKLINYIDKESCALCMKVDAKVIH